jgi:hypothetical protein
MSGFNKTMKLKTFFLLLLVVITSVTAQDYKWGVSLSTSYIDVSDNYHVTFSWPTYHVQYFERKLNYRGYGLHYVGSWTFGDDNEILIKPGVLISRDPFGGIELGLMYKRTFLKDYKLGIGITTNIRDFIRWANGTRTANSTYELSFERAIMKDTFLGVSFIDAIGDNNFGASTDRVIAGEIITSYSKSYLEYMIRAHIEYYF